MGRGGRNKIIIITIYCYDKIHFDVPFMLYNNNAPPVIKIFFHYLNEHGDNKTTTCRSEACPRSKFNTDRETGRDKRNSSLNIYYIIYINPFRLKSK